MLPVQEMNLNAPMENAYPIIGNVIMQKTASTEAMKMNNYVVSFFFIL